jgi:DNA-binding response OmpR family regulator
MLPELDGLEFCSRLRRAGIQTPVLFLTVKGAPEDRIRGFEAGGDDYLTKPFHLQELLLRVAAILRRSRWYEESPAALEFGGNRIDFRTYQARSWDGARQSHARSDISRRSRNALPIVTREEIRPRLGLRGLSLDPHDRQLHRADSQALRAQSRSAVALSYRPRRRLPLYEGRRYGRNDRCLKP